MTRPLLVSLLLAGLASAGVTLALARHAAEVVRPVASGTHADAAAGCDFITLRVLVKDCILEDLVEGRLSLAAAAALFRELDRMPPAQRYPTDAVDPPVHLPARPRTSGTASG